MTEFWEAAFSKVQLAWGPEPGESLPFLNVICSKAVSVAGSAEAG